MFNIINDDCLNGMTDFADNHFHSCVTDPPYGLSFMGKNWDHGVPNKIYWDAVLRVLRPGGHLLAFGGTRMFHRLMVEIEDAGFEIRDTIMWVYGVGFPKGNNISKAIDKILGQQPTIVGPNENYRTAKVKGGAGFDNSINGEPQTQYYITEPSTDLAKQWQGWNTNLKPAWEPIIVARKPVEETVAQNVIKYGTGGINIDGCRIEGEPSPTIDRRKSLREAGKKCFNLSDSSSSKSYYNPSADYSVHKPAEELGRYPANLIHDGEIDFPNNAARFFYCAKTSIKDRNEGCAMFEPQVGPKQMQDGSQGKIRSNGTVIKDSIKHHNHHPTVKPTSLMQYLCRLVTPKDGIILDPFCGSGSTGKAAILEGFNFVGIEKEAEYAEIAKKRCEHAQNRTDSAKNQF